MLMKCAGDGWLAEILVSSQINPDGLVHCEVRAKGDSQKQVLAGIQYLFQMFTGGRESYVRAYPEASSDRDFDTKETRHTGYTRFTVVAIPDKQTDLTNKDASISFATLGQTVTRTRTDGTNG